MLQYPPMLEIFLGCEASVVCIFSVSDDEEESAPRIPPAAQTGGLTGGVASVVAMETDKPVEEESAGEGPMEKRTVFVSNLPHEVTDVKLREKFSEVRIRLVVSGPQESGRNREVVSLWRSKSSTCN